MEALGHDTGLEPTLSDFVFVVFILGEKFLYAVDEELLGPDDEDLVPLFFLEFSQRHPMFLEEPDELLAGNAAVLAAGDAVASETAGIKPLRHRPGRDLADLRDLAGGENLFHGRHSSVFARPVPTRPPPANRVRTIACFGRGPRHRGRPASKPPIVRDDRGTPRRVGIVC